MDSRAALRVAIVGPGRLGSALGRRWREAGVSLLGYLGRSPASATAACEFAGGGEVLDTADLAAADAVLLAVQDDRLEAVVREFADALPKLPQTAVWLHASGSHGLEVLQPLAQAGVGVGAMHPICPLPDPEIGYQNLAGQPAVVLVSDADGPAAVTLCALSEAAGLHPVVTRGGDRLVYHAACVLAANGLTALYSVVDELLARALPDVEAQQIAPALMQAALDSCGRSGPTAALSGPVLRGDADLLDRQVSSLTSVDPQVAEIYRGLMRRAAEMAEDRGALSGEALQAVRRVLSADA